MGFIIRGLIWDIPILIFAYVPCLGPYSVPGHRGFPESPIPLN